ncbi:hypothetical protein [uncultured Flavobacterium sp.]|uniref:hypothetical protein n=1 Tax=uncultured Flavobacterium sp. TaxID=165435 RepID=UPI002610E90D|nr:hypothetical protein [uncultured Flavobacterium sp.]
MNRLKKYLKDQFYSFDKSFFTYNMKFKKSLIDSLYWLVPAFLFVILTKNKIDYLPNKYFEKAISEGIGPTLWNVIGAMGLFFLGLFFLFPSVYFFAKATHRLVENAYSIGLLSLGLIVGEIFFWFPSIIPNFSHSKNIIIAIIITILIIIIYLMNYSLYYVGQLLEERNNEIDFRHLVKKLELRIRITFFVIFSIIPCIFLLSEI